MEKRVTGIYFAVLIIGMIYAVFAANSFRNNIYARAEDKEVAIWNDQMEMTQEEGVYYYRRILPSQNISEKVILYNTVHMYLDVFIDGNKVYELTGEKDRAVKTVGFCWNVISLAEDDAGKEIVFQVTPVYSGGKPNGNFYFGTYSEIEHTILSERLVRIIVSGMIALAGIVMLLYGIFVVKKEHDAETIIQFSIFAVMLGIWAVIETQVPDLIFPCNIVMVFLSHLTLMIMPLPFMLFLRHMYHNGNHKLWSLCCYINCVVIAVRVFLQVFGIYDFKETLILTHIYIVLFVLVIVAMTIHEIAVNETDRMFKINSVCVLIILVSTVLELLFYRISDKSTPFGSIGFLFYIVVMGIVNVRRYRELMEQARESELYRKLAFTDELTGLANRTAFKEDLEMRVEPDKSDGEEKILPTVVYMFDLNDLKKCNDNYGHDYGDKYIKMAAGVLKKLFAQEGKCYRIGGDEFCAWAPYTSLDAINEKLQMLEHEVKELNKEKFVVEVSVSTGYAVYQENMDGGGLYSTMKRADAMMYEHKQEFKKRKSDKL
ncbi:MAG: GGDEF domain-containing protein [Lachnospiraceae bacterium]|nr:GGDEF domain-containing protein [Lachnospiraceae bacterium]